MKKIFFILLFIGISSVYAQNSITGKITDSNNTPLYGVEIYAPELHKGTTSKENGSYVFKNIPNGKITINFSYLGFKTVSKAFVFNGKDEEFNLALEEAIFLMDEVIVATPFNKLQSENVMKVEHLNAKYLQKAGATTLSEGISNIAGVSQISTGTGIGKPVIRGLSGNRVLVYTQGIRLENQQFGSEHGLGINNNGIESIEVIKGPASLLYGSDALGGVLYINPEKFAKENDILTIVTQQYFSNTIGSNSSLGIKGSTETWKFLARGSYAIHSDYKIPTSLRVTNTRFKEKDLKLGVGFNKKNFTSELRYNFNNTKVGIPEDGIGAQTKITTPEEPYQDIDNHIISLHNHLFLGNSKLDIDLGYTVNIRKEFEHHEHEEDHEDEDHEDEDHEGEDHEEHEAEGAALNMKLKTFTYNAKYHLPKFGKVESIFGVQGLHQSNKNYGEEILIPDANITDFGVFYTILLPINKVALQAGIRFDNRNITTQRHEVIHEGETEPHIFEAIDKSYNSFTASAGIKTELFNALTTRLNIATGFRSPNLAELASNGVHHGTNRFEVGNSNLNNEKNTQIDLSLAYQTNHFEWFSNAFYNHVNNYIFLSPTGEVEDGAPVFNYIQENAKLYGGEVGFHLHPHPLDWLHLESSFEMVIGKQDNGNYLPLIPANTWKNTLRTEFNVSNWLQQGYASASLQTVFSQENISAFETTTSGYSLINLGFGGNVVLGNFTFNTTLSVNNLFDKKYINHLSRLKTDGILNAGRNIVIGVNFEI